MLKKLGFDLNLPAGKIHLDTVAIRYSNQQELGVHVLDFQALHEGQGNLLLDYLVRSPVILVVAANHLPNIPHSH